VSVSGAKPAIAVAALSLFLVLGARSQVLEISGGSSSLYQAHGGQIRLHGNTYDASVGAGTIGGRFMGSAQVKMSRAGADYVLGTDTIAENLHTDIFDTDHYLMAVGAGVRTKIHGTYLFAFAGGASADYDSPLFAGARAQNPVGMLFLHRQLTPGVTADTQAIASDRQTAIESVEWKAANNVTVAASGGIGSNQPYGAISLNMSRKWIDLKMAYIEAGSGFRRLNVKTPLFAEPEHENAILTLRPTSFLTLSGGRQNYLIPQYPIITGVKSEVNEGSAEIQVAGLSLSGSLFASDYQNRRNISKVYTASRNLSQRVHVQCSYLESQTAHMVTHPDFISQVQENVTRRWDVSQLITTANGNTAVSFGGGFVSNMVTATIDYQTYYVPANATKPIEQAMMLDTQFHLFNGVSAHAATLVSAYGALAVYDGYGGVCRTRPTGSSAGREHVGARCCWQHAASGPGAGFSRPPDSRGCADGGPGSCLYR
jgi:hypothetical protein